MSKKRVPRKVKHHGHRPGIPYANVMFKVDPAEQAYIQNRPVQAIDEIILGCGALPNLKTARVRTEYIRQMAVHFNEADQLLAVANEADEILKQAYLDYCATKRLGFDLQSYLQLWQAFLHANAIDAQSVRREQYTAYVKSVEIVQRDPVFGSL